MADIGSDRASGGSSTNHPIELHPLLENHCIGTFNAELGLIDEEGFSTGVELARLAIGTSARGHSPFDEIASGFARHMDSSPGSHVTGSRGAPIRYYAVIYVGCGPPRWSFRGKRRRGRFAPSDVASERGPARVAGRPPVGVVGVQPASETPPWPARRPPLPFSLTSPLLSFSCSRILASTNDRAFHFAERREPEF